jgi:glycosyltransferase involved in cell wall biosynthesis
LKKILFITFEYPTYTPFGGIAFYYGKVAHILAGQNFDITLLSAQVAEIEMKAIEVNQTNNLKEVFIPCKDTRAFQQLALKWLFQNNNKYDIIEIPEYGALFYNYIISGELKTFAKKIVVRVHGTTLLAVVYGMPNNFRQTVINIYNWFLLNRVSLKLLKYAKSKKYKIAKANFREFGLIKNADIVTAPSYKMASFVNLYWLKSKKTIVFPNPSQYAIGAYEKKSFDKTLFNVSYVNRLQYLKGFDLFHLLAKKFSKEEIIHFSAFGSYNLLNFGPIKEQVIETVKLKGFVDSAELVDVYRKSQVIIVPSRFESFSNVALEAMGYGCILIVSDNIGMSEHIANRTNGFVFQSGKYDALESIFTEIIGMERSELESISFNAYQTALALSKNKELLEFYHSL